MAGRLGRFVDIDSIVEMGWGGFSVVLCFLHEEQANNECDCVKDCAPMLPDESVAELASLSVTYQHPFPTFSVVDEARNDRCNKVCTSEE